MGTTAASIAQHAMMRNVPTKQHPKLNTHITKEAAYIKIGGDYVLRRPKLMHIVETVQEAFSKVLYKYLERSKCGVCDTTPVTPFAEERNIN